MPQSRRGIGPGRPVFTGIEVESMPPVCRQPGTGVGLAGSAGIAVNVKFANNMTLVRFPECQMLARRQGSSKVVFGHGYVMVRRGTAMDRPVHMPT
jgi:hypothetical protein